MCEGLTMSNSDPLLPNSGRYLPCSKAASFRNTPSQIIHKPILERKIEGWCDANPT